MLRELILHAVKKSDTWCDTETFAFLIMPNHLHWLVRLGGRLTLGQVVGRLKADSRAALASSGLRWQRDFFERRLRNDERAEDYGRYIFLNPYRAGLLDVRVAWIGWWCPRPEHFEFLSWLNTDGSVPREWLGTPEKLGERDIQTGRD